ncbi:MAG: DUF1800 domain-containing protein [Phycisphaeraceae bacterium]
MSIDTSLSPLPPERFGRAEAWHLLQRAGFGPDADTLDRAVRDGLDVAVDRLVDYDAIDAPELEGPDVDPDVRKPLTEEQNRELRLARKNENDEVLEKYHQLRQKADRGDRRMITELRGWWLDAMASTPRPLEEKLTLLWHDHFASSHRAVRDAYLLWQQNELFRRHACGNFADLALGVVKDPAMLNYLNNDRNRKRRPNENLAREFMELFTLSEGQYTEQDIREAARALTGYTYEDNDFLFDTRHHDYGEKRILGVAERYDGEGFVRRLLSRQACSEFIALKLYRHFVADISDNPEEAPATAREVIPQIAREIRRSRYEMRPAVRRLLKSRHFYDAALRGQKVKSPVHFAASMLRVLGNPKRNRRPLQAMLRNAGQELFAPPSVDGWAGGRAWINTSTLFLRQNLAAYLVTNDRGANINPDRLGYDPVALAGELEEPTTRSYADRMVDLMLGPHVRGPAREGVLDAADRAGSLEPRTAAAIVLLITAVPEYQLC